MKSVRAFIVIAFLVGLLWGIFALVGRNRGQNAQELEVQEATTSADTAPDQVLLTPEEEPLPFEELTIPYLRLRDYQSHLSQPQKIAESTNYTSYLTSYLSDGLAINALLTRPKGEMPLGGWPGVIFVHGYIPPDEYQTNGESYSDYVDYLARSGIAVFKIDLRGHGQSQGDAEGAYYSSAYVIDVLNAREALSTTSFVKEDSIGLWGHSMAGNVVLRAVAAEPTIKAAVIWAGAVYSYEDWQQYGLNDNSYQPPSEDSPRRQRRQELMDTHGEFKADSPFWQQVAPTNYLNDLGTAIQLHHAINDPVVSIEYSRNLANILTQANMPHQLNEYQSGGHNLTGAAFNVAMDRTVAWFQTYLTDSQE